MLWGKRVVAAACAAVIDCSSIARDGGANWRVWEALFCSSISLALCRDAAA